MLHLIFVQYSYALGIGEDFSSCQLALQCHHFIKVAGAAGALALARRLRCRSRWRTRNSSDADILRLEILLETLAAPFPSDSGFLNPPKQCLNRCNQALVHADHPIPQSLGNAESSAQVTRVQIASKPELCLVCLMGNQNKSTTSL